MELKKILIFLFFILFTIAAKAELIKPNKKLEPYDVVKIQLEALKNNDSKDDGIMQTWLFAHPDNKKITGPFARFRTMIYGQQYKYLINHSSHHNSNQYHHRLVVETIKQLIINSIHHNFFHNTSCVYYFLFVCLFEMILCFTHLFVVIDYTDWDCTR